MRLNLSALLAAGAIAMAGCGGSAPAMNDPADLAAVNAIRTSFATAFNAGDADAIGKLYTSDGMSMTNHQPTASGIAAIVASNKAFFAGMSVHAEIAADETMTMGTMGIDRGHYKMTLTPKAGGPPMTDEGRYAVWLKKGADGAWKVAWDIDNSSLPMPAPPPATMAPAKGK